MRSPAQFKEEVEGRLKQYLLRDQSGIRREMLKIFVRVRSFTVRDIYENLRTRFRTTYHSVASMIGIIASRIGILHVRRSGEGSNTIYELKTQYVGVVVKNLGQV